MHLMMRPPGVGFGTKVTERKSEAIIPKILSRSSHRLHRRLQKRQQHQQQQHRHRLQLL
jgi:guanylate kinase